MQYIIDPCGLIPSIPYTSIPYTSILYSSARYLSPNIHNNTSATAITVPVNRKKTSKYATNVDANMFEKKVFNYIIQGQIFI